LETHVTEEATRRQAFFESEAVDQLVTMVLELAAEQWVLRERIYAIEKAAATLGLKLTEAVENYRFNDHEKNELATMRKTMIDNLMRSVNREHRRLRSTGDG
jgi:predicted RNase H-like nuclease (RuvC/YqgF family)